MKKQYEILNASTLEALTQLVNKKIEEEYAPIGGVSYVPDDSVYGTPNSTLIGKAFIQAVTILTAT